jgi:hypothetical protein
MTHASLFLRSQEVPFIHASGQESQCHHLMHVDIWHRVLETLSAFKHEAYNRCVLNEGQQQLLATWKHSRMLGRCSGFLHSAPFTSARSGGEQLDGS